LVGPGKLSQTILVYMAILSADRDLLCYNALCGAGTTRDQNISGVRGRPELHPCADVGGLTAQERHSLPLHIRAHERTVSVVVFEKRYQRRGDGDRLQGCHIHIINLVGRDARNIAPSAPGQNRLGAEDSARPLLHRRVGLGDGELLLLVSGEVLDLVGHDSTYDLAVRRLHEAVLVDRRERRELSNKPNVRTLRCLDRTHPPIVCRVHVAHLYGGPLSTQAPRAHRAQASPVREAA
jgi:hypothetical protein